MSLTELRRRGPSELAGRERSRIPSLRGASLRLVIAACFAIALVSLALPFAPAFDPWTWLTWGRELAALELNTGASWVSWKPLPVLIAAILSPFGDLAPELWLVVVRAGSLLALALAYRLGTRLAGSVGGIVAALGLLLTPQWLELSAVGFSEPLLAALALWAVEQHLDGHRGQAFFLGFLVALGRPEAAFFLALYGALAWRREPRKLLAVLAAGAALILLWFGVDWLASGSPVTGSTQAAEPDTTRVDLGRPLSLLLAPVWLLALVGVVTAARDARTARQPAHHHRSVPQEAWVTLVLAAGALAWIAVVVAMMALGYWALPRFMLPAGAALCVVAGVGAARLLKVIAPSRVAVPALAGLVLLIVPFAIARIADLPAVVAYASEHATHIDVIHGAVEAAGGADRLNACGPIGSADARTEGVLAWQLGVPLDAVEIVTRDASGPLEVAVVLAPDRSTALEILPPQTTVGQRSRLERLGGSGDWSVFAPDCPPAEPRGQNPDSQYRGV